MRQRAFYFWDRANKSLYGEPLKRSGSDSVIDHFVDTRFSTASGNFYLDNNKGELQYTWALFAKSNPGAAHAQEARPRLPMQVKVSRQPGSERIRIALAPGSASAPLRSVEVMDWKGRHLADLTVPGQASGPGPLDLVWNGPAASGVYFLRIVTARGSSLHPVCLGP
jgi:hypothetical protein